MSIPAGPTLSAIAAGLPLDAGKVADEFVYIESKVSDFSGLVPVTIPAPINFGVDIGSVNAPGVLLVPAIASAPNGLAVSFLSSFSNTGPMTLQVNSFGGPLIYQNGTPIIAGAVLAGSVVTAVRMGLNWVLVSSLPVNASTIYNTAGLNGVIPFLSTPPPFLLNRVNEANVMTITFNTQTYISIPVTLLVNRPVMITWGFSVLLDVTLPHNNPVYTITIRMLQAVGVDFGVPGNTISIFKNSPIPTGLSEIHTGTLIAQCTIAGVYDILMESRKSLGSTGTITIISGDVSVYQL